MLPASALDPTAAWAHLAPHQVRHPVQSIAPDSPRSPGALRVVCISDTHGMHEQVPVPPGDILLHTGDLTGTGAPAELRALADWLGSQPHTHKVVIAGNHDLTLHVDYYRSAWRRFHRRARPFDAEAIRHRFVSDDRFTYLEDGLVELGGLRIYGSPWQPTFYDWAFNLDRGAPIAAVWDRIPRDVDILLTHGPPLGRGDLCVSGQRAGCLDLLKAVQGRVRPRFHVFGHIHEGYGATSDGHTTYINASTCTVQYQPRQPPFVFDVLPQRK